MANTFLVPPQIVYGENALSDGMKFVKSAGKKALIVTDSVMVKIGNVKRLEDELNKVNIDYYIYEEINSEPTDAMVSKGVNLYKEHNCDFIIAIGGGSPIDAMKAIGVVVGNGGEIVDYFGKEIPHATPPLVAIPTTAGTGSEATAVTVITDTQNDIKMMFLDPVLVPKLAIVDPFFTLTMPSGVTVATGVDALTHAIEAYTSKKSHPLTDLFAMSAVKRIYNNFLKVHNDPEDIHARSEMLLGSTEAGAAFHNSSVTIVHGMSRPIGALFGVPHGLSNAMLLKDCLLFIKQGAEDKFAQLAKELDFVDSSVDEATAADVFYDKMIDLLVTLKIPTLEEFGVNKEEFYAQLDKMADDALASGSPDNTRNTPSKDDIIQLYKKLWD